MKLVNMLPRLFVLSAVFLIALNLFLPSSAVCAASIFWPDGDPSTVGGGTGLGDGDPRIIAANIIKIALGFLGILSVCLILFGGFKWMTAAGNDDRVSEAKKLLLAAIVGLIIIVSAFALSTFVLDAVYSATGGK